MSGNGDPYHLGRIGGKDNRPMEEGRSVGHNIDL